MVHLQKQRDKNKVSHPLRLRLVFSSVRSATALCQALHSSSDSCWNHSQFRTLLVPFCMGTFRTSLMQSLRLLPFSFFLSLLVLFLLSNRKCPTLLSNPIASLSQISSALCPINLLEAISVFFPLFAFLNVVHADSQIQLRMVLGNFSHCVLHRQMQHENRLL